MRLQLDVIDRLSLVELSLPEAQVSHRVHIMLERPAHNKICGPQSSHAASAILCRSALRFLLSWRCSLKLCSAACSMSARYQCSLSPSCHSASLLKAMLSRRTIPEYSWLSDKQRCNHSTLLVSQAIVVFNNCL